MNRWVLLAISCAAIPAAVIAQDSTDVSPVCWHARPKPECEIVVLTDFGLYYTPIPSDKSGMRAVADWGVLFNISETDAFGITVFGSLDHDEFSFGPEVRYRRWLGSEQSIDVAIGLPLPGLGNAPQGSWAASPHGLVKWNPVHWFGIALRPELRRRTAPKIFVLDPSGFLYQEPGEGSSFYMSAGVEFGWIPGVSLAAAGGVAALLLAILFSGMR
jgi:hypothetical protein